MFQCNNCKKTFPYKYRLVTHLRGPRKCKPFQEEIKKALLENNILNIDPERKVVCMCCKEEIDIDFEITHKIKCYEDYITKTMNIVEKE